MIIIIIIIIIPNIISTLNNVNIMTLNILLLP
jgi:hypothetical protein